MVLSRFATDRGSRADEEAAVIAAYRSLIERPRDPVGRSCSSKSVFTSRREAVSLSRHGHHQDGTLQAYHCPHCEFWHLGHRRSRVRPR